MNTTCQHCGKTLTAKAVDGLCPECLLKVGLGSAPGAEPVAAQPPLTPAELAEHFPQLEIIECLGRGGMGVVYKARQKSLNRFVALKLLAPERVTDPKFAERFAQEARALAALNHPHIVTIYDFGQAGGCYFLLMEFVDGVNLRQAMKAGRFTPEQALAVVPPVCEALQYAHNHGIVHRDIKPENLLLDKEGRVKIADFGLAKMLGAESGPGVTSENAVHTGGTPVPHSLVAGTPQYMAPEQQNTPQRVDSRADIYSLGVVLYEMLTGELPGKPLEPPSHKVQIDVRLDAVVLRALEKKPELRYQQVSDVKTMVETIATTPPPQPKTDDRRPETEGDQNARQQVKAPAIGLMALGILNWILIPAFLILAVVQITGLHLGGRMGLAVLLLIAKGFAELALNSLMIFGARKMKRLESFEWAGLAAIFSIVLCILEVPVPYYSYFVGIPLGVWALVVLRRPGVRAAFRQMRNSNGNPPVPSIGKTGAATRVRQELEQFQLVTRVCLRVKCGLFCK